MIPLDWLLIILLILGFLSGLWVGFIHKVGSLLGTILGIIIGSRYYDSIDMLFGGGPGGKIIAFMALLTLTSFVVGIIFRIINRIFHLIAIIPGLKSFNRLLGGLMALLQRIIIFSIVFYYLQGLTNIETVAKFLEGSKIVPIFISLGEIIAPLLPELWQEAQTLI